MKRLPFLLHALSPLHCGTGQGVEIIDLPIARMRSTGIPIIPGSSLKGVLRSVAPNATDGDESNLQAVFGPDTAKASDNAGALVVGDCRLLLLPVRSFRGAFAWVTSPLLLHLAARDLSVDGLEDPPDIPKLPKRGALVAAARHVNVHNDRIYLEDIDLSVNVEGEHSATAQWAERLATMLDESERDLLRSRLTIVDDETMAFFWETATQIDARNRLNEQGTVVEGALWYEESLPPETILIGQLAAERSRRDGVDLSAQQVLEFALPAGQSHVLQVGGKATVGRGICRIHLIRSLNSSENQHAAHA